MEILALIPARGGSKGIPRKNLLSVAGKPLVAYSIEQALASRHITRTIVSTDDPEIADVSRQHGADVPFVRPAHLAADRSTDFDVFRHALEWLRDCANYRCDLVVHLRPTAPVRRPAVMDAAIDAMLARADADSLRSVSRPRQTPYKMWRISGSWMEPLARIHSVVEPHSLPRQDLPDDVYWQNGYVDIIRSRVVLDDGVMAGRRVLPFVIDDPVPELDYVEDVPALEAALLALGRGDWPASERRPVRHPV